MYIGNSGEFYRDESGSICGPDVKLVMTMASGDKVVQMVPAAIASLALLFNDIENGSLFVSGHIEYGGILDVWGGSV